MRHGWITWVFAVLIPTVLTVLIHWLLWQVNVLLAFVWSVAVLYVTLGFRQFSHYFTDIRDALDDGDEVTARELLAQWRQVDASELPRSEIVRHVIEYSVLNYSQRFPASAPMATPSRNDGLILAATSGAVNVRLGGEALKAVVSPLGSPDFEAAGLDVDDALITESTPGREPELAHLRSVVGLVWRSVVLWMVLLALLTLARLLG